MGKLQQMLIYVYEQDSNESCHRCSQLQQKCHKFVTLASTRPCWECIDQGEYGTCSFKNIDRRLLVTFNPDVPIAHLLGEAEGHPNAAIVNISQQSNIGMLLEEAISEPIYDSKAACDSCSALLQQCDRSPSSRTPCTNCQAEKKKCDFSKRRKPSCFPCILRKTQCRGPIPCTACSERETADRCEDQSIEFGNRLGYINDNHKGTTLDAMHMGHQALVAKDSSGDLSEPYLPVSPHIGDYHVILSYMQMLEIPIFDFLNHIECDFSMGKYIGSGAVMNVFKGVLTKNEHKIDIALKIPRNLITNQTDINQANNILADIRQEFRVMKHLDKHPSIVSLFGVAFKDLNPVLVVERALTNLTMYLISREAAQNPVDWLTKRRFCCEIADGLQAVHKIKVVHGDLKADNILLFAHPSEKDKLIAKVSDFGFSATNTSIAEGRNTGGTPRFCAPECTPSAPRKMRKNWANKPQKDIYSYGILVWQIAQNGEEPFKDMGIEVIDYLKKICKDNLNWLIDNLNEEVPDDFKEVIEKMTAYNPEDRAPLEKVREIMEYFDNDSGHVGSSIDIPTKEPPRRTELPDIKLVQLVSIPPPIKAELFRAYEEEARNKNKMAAFFVSVCYGSGFGVEVNKREMVTWAIRAAEYGNLQAIKNIASQFSFWELPDNRNKMFDWLLHAANDGHRDSMKWVAFCYCYGDSVERRDDKWEEWKEKFNATQSVDEPGPSLKPALYSAVDKGNIEAVRFIIQQTKTNVGAADVVTAVDEFKRTPLHIAAEHGREELVNILLKDYGANINAKDSSGCTPLYVAAGNSRVGVVEALLKLSADVNIKDEYGRTVMHEAASKGNIHVIRLLREKIDDVNATSDNGETPLLLAVEGKHIDAAKLLIEYGADTSIADEYGRTPLSLALKNDIADMLRL